VYIIKTATTNKANNKVTAIHKYTVILLKVISHRCS